MKFEFFIANNIGSVADKKNSVTRPIISIATGAIAISLIVMLIAILSGQGLQKEIRNKVAQFGGHIRIVSFQQNQIDYEVSIKNDPILINELRQHPNIKNVHLVTEKTGLLKTKSDFEGVVLKGIDNHFNPNFFSDYLKEGSLPYFQNESAKDSIVISKSLANKLELKLGDKVAMYFLNKENSRPKIRALKIAGIYSSGLEDFDANYVFGSVKQLQSINNWESDEIGAIEISLNTFNDLKTMDKWVYDKIHFDLSTQNIEELHPQLLQWVNLFDTNIMLILGVMIAIGLVNIATALLIMILERTQMIGILKALGSSAWSIRKIFIIKSVQLIIKGLLIGNVIGLGFGFVQKNFKWIRLDESSYYVSYVPIHFDCLYIISINLLVILISMVSLLLPSWIITKIKPIKAIRFE